MAVLLVFAVGANAVAFMQARRMTHFVDGGRRTAPPERLSAVEAAVVVLTGVTVPRPLNRRTPAQLGLMYRTHRFPSGHGPELEAWEVPGKAEQPLVLLFHGYAASKAALLTTARGLYGLGAGTLLVDFHGSGGSSGSGTTLGVREAQDVAAAVAFARRRWPQRRLVLYGFSMGGAAVLRAVAQDGLRPDGLVLEATFDSLLRTTRARVASMGLPATPVAELLLFWGGVQQGFDPFRHTPAVFAGAVTCPVLQLQGAEDRRVSLDAARALHAAFTAPAELVVVPGVGHQAIARTAPDAWRAAVAPFLAHIATPHPGFLPQGGKGPLN